MKAQGPPDILVAADAATLSNVTLPNITITKAGTYGIEIADCGGRGTVNFESIVATYAPLAPLQNTHAPASFFHHQLGNVGW